MNVAEVENQRNSDSHGAFEFSPRGKKKGVAGSGIEMLDGDGEAETVGDAKKIVEHVVEIGTGSPATGVKGIARHRKSVAEGCEFEEPFAAAVLEKIGAVPRATRLSLESGRGVNHERGGGKSFGDSLDSGSGQRKRVLRANLDDVEFEGSEDGVPKLGKTSRDGLEGDAGENGGGGANARESHGRGDFLGEEAAGAAACSFLTAEAASFSY